MSEETGEKDTQNEDEDVGFNLHTIPVEVLLKIFNYVDATDLLRNVSLVSKYFYAILSNEMTWKIKMEKRWGSTGDRKFPPVDLLPDTTEPDPQDTPLQTYPQFTTTLFPWSRACVKREEQIKLWTSPNSTPTLTHSTLKSHIGCIDSIHLFKKQNSMLLACGSRDRAISLWRVEEALEGNTEDSKIKILYKAHEGWIWDFSVGRDCLMSCSWDTTAKIWDLGTLEVVGEFKSNTALLSISSTNSTIAIGAFNRKILLLDPRNPQKPTNTFTTHTRSVLSVGLDATYLLSCGEDGLIARHDLRSNKLESSFKLQSTHTRTYPTCMSFRETNLTLPYFYIGDNTGQVHVINQLDFKPEHSKQLHNSPVRGVFNNLGSVVSCSREGKLVVSSSCLGLTELRVVDVGNKIELPCVHSVDNVVACGGGDGSVYVWGAL